MALKHHEKYKDHKIVRTLIDPTDYVDMRIRLNHDEMSYVSLMAGLVKLYIEQDQDMLTVVDKIKKQTENRKKRIAKAKKEGKESLKTFGIDKEDIENIFDVLEQDFPEL